MASNEDENPLSDFFFRKADRVVHKWHHYFDVYHRHMNPIRKACRSAGRKVRMMEIGIDQGGSLQMWLDYFGGPEHVELYAVDNDPRLVALARREIPQMAGVFVGDQANPIVWREIMAVVGAPLDIILDDGGHRMDQQIITLRELFPHVRPGGIFICEDTHTSYWANYGGGLRLRGNTFIEKAKDMVDDLHFSYWPAALATVDEALQCEFRKFGDGIHFYDSMVIFDRHPNPDGRPAPAVSKRGDRTWCSL